MQTSKRYSFWGTILWSKKYILYFLLIDSIPVSLYYYFEFKWLLIPWQPISLVGIGVSFYLGFKNNSSYDRLWEARKIWGGIVNSSRTFTIMIRDFTIKENLENKNIETNNHQSHLSIVHRHIVWLKALTYQLREKREWEHYSNKVHNALRIKADIHPQDDHFKKLQTHLSEADYQYIISKGNKASHILSLQSKEILKLRNENRINDFRHMELMKMLKEFYALQGQSERIKNFPFPRQYASVNYFFVWIFVALLPFGMLTIFSSLDYGNSIWLVVPFSVLVSWIFIMMELVGEFTENPFEGLFNDVPITSIARDIEIDILEMCDEADLPTKIEPLGKYKILV